MDRLKIVHESGYMELNVDMFFPCVIQTARKIFPLINRWCSNEDKVELESCLLERLAEYKSGCEECAEKIKIFEKGTSLYKQWKAEFNKTNLLYKRMKRNIELYKKD